MATITKRKERQWQAKIRRKGIETISKTFPTKVLAQQWARQIEVELDSGTFLPAANNQKCLLSNLLDKYLDLEVPKKKSYSDYKSRLALIKGRFGGLDVSELTVAMIREFRDERLEYVKPDTVRKDISLLGRVIKHAISEWDIALPHGNPVSTVKLPPKGKSRQRRLLDYEELKLQSAAQNYGGMINAIITLALETGARRGELQRLRWENISFQKRTALLLDTKNGEDREIPLSNKALATLKSIPCKLSGSVFRMQADSISQAFSRVCRIAGINDLWFHDLRHEATSRFFEMGLEIIEVSSITGHKDLRMLRNYTHLKAEDLAEKIRLVGE